jgi:hypothetical protein
MGMKDLIIEEVDSICDKLLKRTALEAMIASLESMEQTLILGIETLSSGEDREEHTVLMRLKKAQYKVDVLRSNINDAKKLIQTLDERMAEFEKV